MSDNDPNSHFPTAETPEQALAAYLDEIDEIVDDHLTDEARAASLRRIMAHRQHDPGDIEPELLAHDEHESGVKPKLPTDAFLDIGTAPQKSSDQIDDHVGDEDVDPRAQHRRTKAAALIAASVAASLIPAATATFVAAQHKDGVPVAVTTSVTPKVQVTLSANPSPDGPVQTQAASPPPPSRPCETQLRYRVLENGLVLNSDEEQIGYAPAGGVFLRDDTKTAPDGLEGRFFGKVVFDNEVTVAAGWVLKHKLERIGTDCR